MFKKLHENWQCFWESCVIRFLLQVQQDLTPPEPKKPRLCLWRAFFRKTNTAHEMKKLLKEDDLRKDGTGAVRNRCVQRNRSRYKSRGESEEGINTWCREGRVGGSLCCSPPDCKFPHLKNGEIHFSHRWEQARLISLKYPICWWERGDASGKERREGGKESKQGWTKQNSLPVLE